VIGKTIGPKIMLLSTCYPVSNHILFHMIDL
jgi:hypothetical protein